MSGALATGIIALALIVTALVVLMLISTWKLFVKAGKPGWNALVPIYSNVVMLEFLSMPLWLIVITVLPFANFAIWIVMSYRLARAFGKSGWFALGLMLLPFIFYPILGFGRAQYQESNVPTGITEAVKWTMIGAAAFSISYMLLFLPGMFGPGSRGLSIISGGSGYATDGTYVYRYDEVIPGADPDSFALLDDYYALDYYSVYYNGMWLSGADASTFELLGSNGYAKDRYSVYYDGRRIADDPSAFEVVDDSYYAVGTTEVYYDGTIIPGANPLSFELLDTYGYYAKDTHAVYCDGGEVEGADPKTFTVEYGDIGGDSYDAKDQYRYYYNCIDAKEYIANPF